jgi:hypothetical protein
MFSYAVAIYTHCFLVSNGFKNELSAHILFPNSLLSGAQGVYSQNFLNSKLTKVLKIISQKDIPS